MKTQEYRPVDWRDGHGDHQRVIRLLRAAASKRGQSDARSQWIRAATRC